MQIKSLFSKWQHVQYTKQNIMSWFSWNWNNKHFLKLSYVSVTIFKRSLAFYIFVITCFSSPFSPFVWWYCSLMLTFWQTPWMWNIFQTQVGIVSFFVLFSLCLEYYQKRLLIFYMQPTFIHSICKHEIQIN